MSIKVFEGVSNLEILSYIELNGELGCMKPAKSSLFIYYLCTYLFLKLWKFQNFTERKIKKAF